MSKQFYFKQFSSALSPSLVLFDLYIGPDKVPPLCVRVDLGAIAIKVYFAFLKAPA